MDNTPEQGKQEAVQTRSARRAEAEAAAKRAERDERATERLRDHIEGARVGDAIAASEAHAGVKTGDEPKPISPPGGLASAAKSRVWAGELGIPEYICHYFLDLRKPAPGDEVLRAVLKALRPRDPKDDLKLYSRAAQKRAAARPGTYHPNAIAFGYPDMRGDEIGGRTRLRFLDDEKPRYVGPTALPPDVYLPRNAPRAWSEVAKNSAIEIDFSEGEILATVACAYGRQCGAFAGVWAFKSKAAGFNFPPTLNDWIWKGRRVRLVWDSDVVHKPGVMAALHALARELKKRGAIIVTKTLPSEPDGSKNGLDDFLIRYGPDAFHALPDEELEEHRELAQLCREFIRVCDEDENYEISSGIRRNDARFLSATRNRRVLVPSPGGRSMASRSAGELYLESSAKEGRIEASRYGWQPGAELLFSDSQGRRCVNLCSGLTVIGCTGDVSLLDALKAHDFGSTAEGLMMCEYFDAHIATMYQEFGLKMPIMWWLYGPQGCGKSLLFNTVWAPFGEYFREVRAKEFKGAFNEYLDRKLVILVNEWSRGQFPEAEADFIKTLSTAQTLTINSKFKNEINYRDTINYAFTANPPNARLMDPDDRRTAVWGVEQGKLDTALGKRIAEWSQTKASQAAIRWYYEHFDREHPKHLPKPFSPADPPPMTKYKAIMIELSRTDDEREDVLRTLIEERKYTLGGKVPEDPSSYDLIIPELEFKRFAPNTYYNANRLRKELGRLGAMPLGQVRLSKPLSQELGQDFASPWAITHQEHWWKLAKEGNDEAIRAALDQRYKGKLSQAESNCQLRRPRVVPKFV